jgi:hypothetical protein
MRQQVGVCCGCPVSNRVPQCNPALTIATRTHAFFASNEPNTHHYTLHTLWVFSHWWEDRERILRRSEREKLTEFLSKCQTLLRSSVLVSARLVPLLAATAMVGRL